LFRRTGAVEKEGKMKKLRETTKETEAREKGEHIKRNNYIGPHEKTKGGTSFGTSGMQESEGRRKPRGAIRNNKISPKRIEGRAEKGSVSRRHCINRWSH